MKHQRLRRLPAFKELLLQTGLKLVDIGGRGEAMPQLVPLAPVADYFTCEPDIAEAERLRVELPRQVPWRSITVISEALAARSGQATLYCTVRPGMSSLLEPDQEVANRSCIGPKFQVTSTRTVPTVTLDEAAARYGFEDACFLKVDTQGTELDILESGGSIIDGVVGIYVETLFHPFYKNQSLFADVDAHLRHCGFSLFNLHRTMVRRAGYRPDFYSQRMVVWAHCLYLRETQALVAHGDSSTAAVSARATRLLALAFAFHHFDLLFELLALIEAEKLLPPGQIESLRQQFEAFAHDQTARATASGSRVRGGDDSTPPDAVLSPSSRDDRYVG